MNPPAANPSRPGEHPLARETHWPHDPPDRPPVDEPIGWGPSLPVPGGAPVAPSPAPPAGPGWGSPVASGPQPGWAPPAPARGRRPRWGCGDIAYGILIAFGLGFVFVIPLALAGVKEDSLAIEAFGALSIWLGLGGWALLCSWVKGLGSLKLDFGWAFRWYDIFIGFGLTVLMFMMSIVLGSIQQAIGVQSASNTQFLETQQENGAGWTYLALTLMVAVGAPIVEELFFRGLTYSAFANRFGKAVAVIGSSAIFGLMHFQPGAFVPTLFLLLNLTVFGLILGLSRMYFQRTGPGVYSHMFFNLTAALVILAGVH